MDKILAIIDINNKMTKILSMNNILDLMKTPKDVNNDIVKRMRARRKEKKLTQAELSRLAGVSLGSLKRFEQTGNISLNSLIKIAFVLDCQEDFDSLLQKRIFVYSGGYR